MFTNGTEFLEGRPPNGNLLSRGRSYSPIDDMVKAIPPGTPINPTAITAELYYARLWSLALITASMDLILARLDRSATHARRAAE